MKPADRMWLAIGGGVVGFNVWACVTRNQMLSERVDDYLLGRRWPTELAIAALYMHLSNRVPPRYDPIHWLFLGVQAICRRLRAT